jgi:hypothetical protein
MLSDMICLGQPRQAPPGHIRLFLEPFLFSEFNIELGAKYVGNFSRSKELVFVHVWGIIEREE